MTTIKDFSHEDQADAVNLLLLAFSNDPFQRYLMPDPSTYLRNSAIWFNNAASQSISLNAMMGTDDYSGIALWFPPNHTIEYEVLDATLKELPSDSQQDIFQYFREFDENKPKDVWYLEYLGVDPFKQSMGLGSALLKSSLEKIDLLHEPAYLESSNPRNMSLYERNGFQTVKKFQFGAGPPIHTMYREAR